MSNPEYRNKSELVHIIMGFLRKKDNEEDTRPSCVRRIYKDDKSIEILEAELTILGGAWRIHKTVNARSTTRARNELIKLLLDHPDKAAYVDSAWKTTLLQKECKAEEKFMLDVDTKEPEKIKHVEVLIENNGGAIERKVETPNGFHIITERGFDTRLVCEFPYVTLLRDGYYFIKKVEPKP